MTRRTCIVTASGMVIPGTFSWLSAADTAGTAERNRVRVVSSQSLVGEVNPTAANTAIIGWKAEIEMLGDLQLTSDAPALFAPALLAQMVRTGTVDGLAVASPGYADPNTVRIDDIYAGGGEDFHEDCPLARIAAFSAAMGGLPKAPGGKQLLSKVQSHDIVGANAPVLDTAGAMFRAAEIPNRSAKSAG